MRGVTYHMTQIRCDITHTTLHEFQNRSLVFIQLQHFMVIVIIIIIIIIIVGMEIVERGEKEVRRGYVNQQNITKSA